MLIFNDGDHPKLYLKANWIYRGLQLVYDIYNGIENDYSLSDLIWLTAFPSFFPTKSSFLPSKLGRPLRRTTACMHKHTFLSQLRKMLILSVRSHCKICPLPNSTNTRDRHCWQWAKFTMGPNEQNHILRSWDKKYVYTYEVCQVWMA